MGSVQEASRMKKIEEKFYCDVCGEEATVYENFSVDRQVFGYVATDPYGMEIIVKPFGGLRKEVCIDCINKALSEKTNYKV